MQKTLKALTPLSLFVRFLVMSALGTLILVKPEWVQQFLVLLCIIALLVSGIPAIFVSIFQKKEPHPHAFLLGLASVVVAVLLLFFPKILRGSITFTVGLWSLLVAVVQFGYVVQLFATHEKGKVKFSLLGIVSLCTSLALLSSFGNPKLLSLVAGYYLILYGFWELVDMIGVLIDRNVESSKLLSKIRVKPPVLLTALLPSMLLRKIGKQYETITKDVIIDRLKPLKRSYAETIEVIFHLGEDVAFGFGHVDVSLRGKTYSYGCYDESSNRLFGMISDGTFLVCDTVPYLAYCRKTEKKILIGFTLGLSREQAEKTETSIQHMFKEDCEPWTPEGRPEYALGGHLYKVVRGNFVLYNALRTNCASMAEIIASESGLNLLPPNGFVTPGAYFGYLQSELRDVESNVLRQTIYAYQA
ncbi:MAG: DUF308 domain-containing protein [Clostridia bacterium]